MEVRGPYEVLKWPSPPRASGFQTETVGLSHRGGPFHLANFDRLIIGITGYAYLGVVHQQIHAN